MSMDADAIYKRCVCYVLVLSDRNEKGAKIG